jgi:hypothetical protein
MNETDIKNLEIIEELVTNHFCLEEESLKVFKKRIYEPVTDNFYKEIFKNSPDLRIRYKIPEEFLEKFDKGWTLFRKFFTSFCLETNIQYSNFRSNKFTLKGRTLKLKKVILDYYLSHEASASRITGIDNFNSKNTYDIECLEQEIINALNKVGVYKLPSSGIEIVFSLNFADWFLSASGEKWSSCINLESNFSGSYWSGLPGLVGDPNRAMLYVTDGSKKIYHGMKTDAFNSRSWIILNKYNDLNLIRFFPSEILEQEVIRNTTKLPFVKQEKFCSKHPIDFLYFKNKKSCFIYIDYSKFSNYNGRYYIEGTASAGHYSYIDKNRGNLFIDGSSIFVYKYGLTHLIDEKINIEKVSGQYCSTCTYYIESISHTFDGRIMCDKCYRERVVQCHICNTEMWIDTSRLDTKNTRVCQHCFDTFYTVCDTCEKTELKSKLFSFKDTKKWICVECLKETEEDIEICNSCRTIFSNVPEGYLITLDNEEIICKTCLAEEIDKEQLFLEFSFSYNYCCNALITFIPNSFSLITYN